MSPPHRFQLPELAGGGGLPPLAFGAGRLRRCPAALTATAWGCGCLIERRRLWRLSLRLDPLLLHGDHRLIRLVLGQLDGAAAQVQVDLYLVPTGMSGMKKSVKNVLIRTTACAAGVWQIPHMAKTLANR